MHLKFKSIANGELLDEVGASVSVRASVKRNGPMRGGLLRGGAQPQLVLEVSDKANRWRDNTPYAKMVMPKRQFEGLSSNTGKSIDLRESAQRDRQGD